MKLSFQISFKTLLILFLPVVLFTSTGVQAQDSTTILIPEGSFHSALPEVPGEPNQVDSFLLDETAVTNREFLNFVQTNPKWRRSSIPSIYAGSSYLDHWENDLTPGDETDMDKPVTRVSWFAANAFCGSRGGRLPTLNEWEFAAQLMKFDSDSEANRFSSELIGWYSAVDALNIQSTGSTGIENRYGVKDLFGLIMEWVEDYNPPVAKDISLDCGTIGRMQGDSSLYGYAMSIRYITRMSFKPTSTTGMLGFRCAYDLPADQKEMEI